MRAPAQVYRALRPTLRPEAAGTLLDGLQRCLEDARPASLASASQLVVTLQVCWLFGAAGLGFRARFHIFSLCICHQECCATQ
jgi:hypothetical protein